MIKKLHFSDAGYLCGAVASAYPKRCKHSLMHCRRPPVLFLHAPGAGGQGARRDLTSPKVTHQQRPLLSTILTTSGALHLLVIGYLGFGIPADTPRPHVVHAAPPPPPIIENVQLEAPPPPKAQKLELKEDEPTPLPDAPAPVAAIAAVPANVSVAFAVKVEGPVHLVSDASLASGAFAPPPPVIPKEASERNLLTPGLGISRRSPPSPLYGPGSHRIPHYGPGRHRRSANPVKFRARTPRSGGPR